MRGTLFKKIERQRKCASSLVLQLAATINTNFGSAAPDGQGRPSGATLAGLQIFDLTFDAVAFFPSLR